MSDDTVAELTAQNESLQEQVKGLTSLVLKMTAELNVSHLVDLTCFPEADQEEKPTPVSVSSGSLPYARGNPGLAHFIGTNQGQREWSNPFEDGLVQVTASTLWAGNLAQVVEPKFQRQVCFTRNVPESWVAIDFGMYKIKPTHYTMSHRCGRITYFMRNWELQGSNTGRDWVVLQQHKNDKTIHEKNYTGLFQVQPQDNFYRHLRVFITEKGNSCGTHALVCACFEVWGDWQFHDYKQSLTD
eukprot:TRINITY_DN66894_c4_g1_i1.p1 TRINITY_DN66894_c4_g1~~TRINITY_DN66894_c4_g1_i1.p1  ORF type:complete len:243 (+),score=6.36 TRINITY_DN66894_c4_g1_i1:96-824(+)